MLYDPQKHHRRSIRIQGMDYSESGAYFITFVTQNRGCSLSKIFNSMVILEPAGKVLLNVWKDLPRHYPSLSLGDMIIMPNHIHAILFLHPQSNQKQTALPEIVRALKSFSARRINDLEPLLERPYGSEIITSM